MDEIELLLVGNDEYVPSHRGGLSASPARKLAVVTCMDARIDPLRVLGLGIGDAHVLRTAGGRVSEDVLASLALSVHALGVRTVMVVHHTECGLTGVTEAELRRLTGTELGFRPIADHEAALHEDLEMLGRAEFLSPVTTLAGALLDIESGALSCLIRHDRVPPP